MENITFLPKKTRASLLHTTDALWISPLASVRECLSSTKLRAGGEPAAHGLATRVGGPTRKCSASHCAFGHSKFTFLLFVIPDLFRTTRSTCSLQMRLGYNLQYNIRKEHLVGTFIDCVIYLRLFPKELTRLLPTKHRRASLCSPSHKQLSLSEVKLCWPGHRQYPGSSQATPSQPSDVNSSKCMWAPLDTACCSSMWATGHSTWLIFVGPWT